MSKFIHEKELVQLLGINRRTAYYWRLQGMPFTLASDGVFRYLYDFSVVKKWAKEHNKKI